MGFYKMFIKLVQRKPSDERLFDDVIGFDDVKVFRMSVDADKPVHLISWSSCFCKVIVYEFSY
jgi:hypothetical protein